MAKTELDWTDIERRLKAKEPVARIARDVGISRQALWKRAQRQGLTLPSQPKRQIASISKALQAIPHNGTGITLGKCVPETASYILDKVQQGWSIETAVGSAGMRRTAFEAWMMREPELDSAIRAARVGFLGTRENNIAQAGNRGQWQADAHILSRDPETRSQWGEQSGGRGGVNVQVVLNIDRTPLDAHHITVVSANAT